MVFNLLSSLFLRCFQKFGLLHAEIFFSLHLLWHYLKIFLNFLPPFVRISPINFADPQILSFRFFLVICLFWFGSFNVSLSWRTWGIAVINTPSLMVWKELFVHLYISPFYKPEMSMTLMVCLCISKYVFINFYPKISNILPLFCRVISRQLCIWQLRDHYSSFHVDTGGADVFHLPRQTQLPSPSSHYPCPRGWLEWSTAKANAY